MGQADKSIIQTKVEDAMAKPEASIELSVSTLTGKCTIVTADFSWSVHGVKAAIFAVWGNPPYEQRLLLDTRILSDTEKLSEVLPSGQTQCQLLMVVCACPLKGEIMTSLVTGRERLANIEQKYLDDKDIVLAAIHFDGLQLLFAQGLPRKDRSICLAAVKQNGFALTYCPKAMRAERDVILMAVKSNAFSITLADISLQNDVDFAIEAVRTNPFVHGHLEKHVQQEFDGGRNLMEFDGGKKSWCHDALRSCKPRRFPWRTWKLFA